VVDGLIKAKQTLGESLMGVVINDIPASVIETTQTLVRPFLESQDIPVLGLLAEDRLLRSVSVRELAHQLNAKVLCSEDHQDLMVESLTIGAMNVNSALEYFRQGENKAVVTGGDRTDLQLAALETSTSCLILTGHVTPQPLIISRASDLEIPILSVNQDTLTTVEIVDHAFGNVRLQEPIKVKCIQKLMAESFDLPRFIDATKRRRA
jgi:BioD-like phosphotransacetylase family protein